MHDLAKRTNAAIRRAKKRDGNVCRVCGRGPVDGAHLLPRRVAFKWYHADDERWIISLCRTHHKEYDALNLAYRKVGWLVRNNIEPHAGLLAKGLNGDFN